MCGRFTLSYPDPRELELQLGLPIDSIEDYKPRYNIAPTDPHFVVRLRGEEWQPLPATWGLLSPWSKDASRAAKQINARAETLEKTPAFRQAVEKGRRCLVPADGFFEWTGPKEQRQPIWYHRPGGGPVLFAGLYDWWKPEGDDGPWQATFTIITTTPNDLIRPIHDRMPVVLPGDAADRWLDPNATPSGNGWHELLVPAPNDYLVARFVSQKANSVKNDTPDVLEEVVATPLPLPSN